MVIEILIFLFCMWYLYILVRTRSYDTEQICSDFRRRDQIVITEQYSYVEHRDQIVTQQHNDRVRNYNNAVSFPSRQFDRALIPRQCSNALVFPARLPEENTVSFLNLPLETNTAKIIISFFSRFSRNNKIRLVVRSIYEVKNPYLLEMYKLRKAEMISRYGCVEEKLFFHGTHQRNVHSICNDNFNWRFFGRSVGNRYGQGVSFTPEAMYASHYCDKNKPLKTMFLVKVLYSNCVIGTEDMVIPFVNQRERIIIYDASRKEDGRVIVKYCDNEFYPAFIIHFESIVL